MSRAGARRQAKIVSVAEAENELEAADAAGARFIAIGEADYPTALRRTALPPPLLAVRGDTSVFAKPVVSIVGARNASVTGSRFAAMIAREIGEAGYAIASGLARGIDTAAHRGSLSTGTIAAYAGGLDRPYPPENIRLADEIVERGGTLISEMPFGWEPRARDFPRRNRLVAGLAHGLVVVEAAMRSGSLISARLAAEMGRVVFAVPGSPLDPRAEGANKLLKDGAVLVTEARDVLAHLAPMTGGIAAQPAQSSLPLPDLAESEPAGDDDRRKVLEALSATPTEIDALMEHSGLSASRLAMVLLDLDLAGLVERHAGGRVSLVLGQA